ncbi:PREDICTED: 26S proteasome non-ATPase regulatory subunit 4 [Diuraphis noxia]|uniref:26S proteasome non-ATPase regulatory subunit 4 n=1 Tax=Diuraphis noxia TaxID=143948 RepID=UPI000763ACB7|nr:PREDICTED: 26S proteasome non-ATPase regulatory subunit 4 [Diuraphis noxia]
MVLESTMICVDNSDYMRNGDFVPTRLQAQQDAVNLVCLSKTRANPENNVGLLTLANVRVLATLTADVGRILSKLHQVQPNGVINFPTGIRIAHLALKHRQGKNHKMRIIAFIGSPVGLDEKEIIKLAKRLKKEKVNVDVVSFGEEAENSDVLTAFVNTLNGKDGGGSHLIAVPPGSHFSEALVSSPVIQGEDGAGGAGLGGTGYEFGVDPNEDPELALALRVSMEEQRARQEQEARRGQGSSAGAETSTARPETINETPTEEAMLERALAMSMETGEDEPMVVQEGSGASASGPSATTASQVDFNNMSEEEQIAFAMQMSMQDSAAEEKASSSGAKSKEEAMEVEEDYSEVIDPEFIQSVLENLPGVDSQSDAVRQAVGLVSKDSKDKDQKNEKDKSNKK